MRNNKMSLMFSVAALSLGFAAAAYAQSFIFRTDVTGSTGDPEFVLTLVSGSGLEMQLDAAGAEPGATLAGETRTLTYQNQVSREITVSSVTVSPNQDNFLILSDGCTGTVVVGGQCSVTVQFQASQDGSYTGSLNIDAS